jgi:hypothetical protein
LSRRPLFSRRRPVTSGQVSAEPVFRIADPDRLEDLSVLIDRRSLSQHWRWIAFTIVATFAAAGWYFLASRGQSRLPGGSSVPGFAFGVIGGLIILFEFFLWPRKKVRTWRIGKTQTWMKAHIWFGLLAVPLLILHSGFRLGETLSAVLMILFIAVILSGIWGLVLQQIIPRRMLNEIPAETIYSQIDRAVEFLVGEAEQIVAATCGIGSGTDTSAPVFANVSSETHITVGAMRKVGSTQGRVVRTIVPPEPIAGTEWLRDVYDRVIGPYLRKGDRSKSTLVSANRSVATFQELRTKVPIDAYPAVDAIEDLCLQRRQFDRQRRLHHWLHGWLLVHVPLSVALVALMVVHIIVTLKYW